MAAAPSLALRLALVALVIGSAGAVMTLIWLGGEIERDFQAQTVASASSVAELIRLSTRAGMLRNQWDEVRDVIHNVGRQPDIVRIRLMNRDGVVVLSSDDSEVGRTMLQSARECAQCHPPDGAGPGGELRGGVRILEGPSGERVLGLIECIPGGPECLGPCHHHEEGHRTLGVIDAQVSLAAADAFSREHTAQLIGAALAVQFSCAAAIAVVVALMLRRRLRPLVGAINRLGGSDYSARAPERGADELAALGRSFNRMAQDLERSYEELQSWTRTLQDRVDEKTRELRMTNDQMLRTERLASLGRLAAVVAHELNNPLAGVQIYARRARKILAAPAALSESRRGEMTEWVDTIDREVGRCGRIVQDLLAFSRRETPQRAPVTINELVQRAARLLGHKLSLEDIALELHLDEALPTVIADGAQIEQALLAVMINAVEAMPEGGVLSVTTRCHPGGGVEIVVEDTGVGIAPEVMAHVLEPFYTTKPAGQGTGLGLSVTYGIISRHDGRLDISSKPGQGTRVTMLFPQVPFGEEAPADATPESMR